MLGSDGPDVNKAVTRLMNEAVNLTRKKSLLDIGTCNIHIVHNAFLKGMTEIGEEASNLIFAVHKYFHGWPSRWENFCEIQERLKLPHHHFIKHCSSRWLTVISAAERMLEQWDALATYFCKHILLQNSPSITNSVRRISKLLESMTMKAEMLFVCSSAKLFTRFTEKFQRDEPLIHVLHSELNALLKALASRVCVAEAVTADIKKETFVSTNLRPLKEIVCGDGVMQELEKASEKEKLAFLKLVQNHYVSACNHIIAKGAASRSHILRSFRFLQPERRNSSQSCADVLSVAKVLPITVREDELADEWTLWQTEEEPGSLSENSIIKYWNHMLHAKTPTGVPKYPNLAKIVKASLSLGHGNADIERRFSSSKRVLSEDCASMSEGMLNAIMTIKDGLKLYGNKPNLVPITAELLSLAKTAKKRYTDHLEEEKMRKEKEKQKEEQERKKMEKEIANKVKENRKSIESKEASLQEKRQDEHRKRKLADSLTAEAQKKLKLAVDNKDFHEVQLAQAILEKANATRVEEYNEKKSADSLQKTID